MTSKEEHVKIQKEMESLMLQETELILKSMPKFERGIAEASLERECEIWEDLSKTFKKYGIEPSISTSLQTDSQPSGDKLRPALVCAGITVSLQYLVNPIDKNGKSGKLSEKVLEEIADIKIKLGKLNSKLELGVK